MTELLYSGFESGDKTEFDGTQSAGSPTVDTVQGTVKDAGAYAWAFNLPYGQDWMGWRNNCWWYRTLPASGQIWLRARVRLDVLGTQYNQMAFPMHLWCTNNPPWREVLKLEITPGTGALQLVVIDASGSSYTRTLGDLTAPINDGQFHTYLIGLDTGASPLQGYVAVDDVYSTSTLTFATTLPVFQQAVFGVFHINWGYHSIEFYMDECSVHDADPGPFGGSAPVLDAQQVGSVIRLEWTP